jgi:hypothetical protein
MIMLSAIPPPLDTVELSAVADVDDDVDDDEEEETTIRSGRSECDAGGLRAATMAGWNR